MLHELQLKKKKANVCNLVTETNYGAKISKIEKKVTDHDHDKCITTSKCNKLTRENFAARLAQANLITETDFDNELISFSKRINSNKTKHLLVENELKNYKHLIQAIFEVKVIFKKMVIKII